MAYSVVPSVNTSDSWTASQHNTYIKDNMAYLKAAIDAMGTTLFPIGSIFISISSTNPSTFIGGTWIAFGTGRTIVGIDAGQTEFDTVEETGGAKTHTLTTPEIPSHTHSIPYVDLANTGGSTGTRAYPGSGTTGSAGGGGAHNNLQPYIVVYMFKRTA